MTKPRCIHDLGVPPVQFLFNGTLAVEKYDFLYHVIDDVRPVSGQADGGSAALNQAAAAPLFAGVSLQAKTANETDADAYFPVSVDVILEVDCVSDTYEVGDRVTFTEDSGGTYLENQKVEKTTDEGLAIGVVQKRYGSATTRVVARFISRVMTNAVQQQFIVQNVTATVGGGTTGLISAAADHVTVTSSSANSQVSLPAANIGKKLTLVVGANGCELISAVAAHEVNGVVVGATNELALAANTHYHCEYVAANKWIVRGFTALGADAAALVPDGL